ncbi:MAG: hypothetical protein M3Z03_04080 [Actinomycetota bacterium]|nr:hypothetical protein [Actinomycetota bacterium]
MDRRAVFFLFAALACVLLVPVSPDRFRSVTIGVGVTYVLLAIASFLDHRSKSKR